jgi:hypothetical protein
MKKKWLTMGDLDEQMYPLQKWSSIYSFKARKDYGECETINATFLYGSIRFQVDGMVPWLMLWEALKGLFTED